MTDVAAEMDILSAWWFGSGELPDEPTIGDPPPPPEPIDGFRRWWHDHEVDITILVVALALNIVARLLYTDAASSR